MGISYTGRRLEPSAEARFTGVGEVQVRRAIEVARLSPSP